MVERNLIREGYIYNTRTPLGAISGTQTVGPAEIDALFDEDVSTTALIVTGTEFISLDADLGGRWKLKRVELYTDEPSATNFDMSISDDGLDFFELTMTGSPPLWVGDVPSSTISGAPRYLRYEQRASVDRNVQEWKAISDDSFVDFGSDGSQTSLTIADAPIGRASDSVTSLTIKNQYSKSAEAFAFVDRTDNAAEDELEISKTPSGPWVGRASSTASQPDITPWEAGEFFQTRIVPSGTYSVTFTDGSLKSWAGQNATVSVVGGVLRGVSTTTSPAAVILNPFQTFLTNQQYVDLESLFADYFSFRAKDVNKVKVRARVVSSIPVSDLVEGPRLFWRNHEEEPVEPFRASLSTLSQVGNSTFTGQWQDFIFEVGNVPTWSGTIRGFGFQPFTTATGTNLIFDMDSLFAYNDEASAVTLDFRPVSSGTFLEITPEGTTADTTNATVLVTRHIIQHDCIITKVAVTLRVVTTPPGRAVFLARPNPGNTFPLRGPGNNFTVPYAIELGEGGNQTDTVESRVFWSAKRGDILGIAVGGTSSVSYVSDGAVAGDAWVSASGISTTSSLSNIQSGLNNTDWTSTSRRYMLSYDAISTELVHGDGLGGYLTTGTYTTPVFDSATVPTLNMLDFESVEPAGTSVDSLTQAGIRTIKVRAADRFPQTSLYLGERGTISGTSETLGLFLNSSAALSGQASVEQINTQNGTVSTREGDTVQNVGGAILYHRQKDELWVLNVLLSGTNPFDQNDARPSWDIFNPHTGEYVATRHMTGDIFYSYNHPAESPNFEPVGFVADYDREEIYLFQRENAFFVGAGTYHGLILDLDGNFQDVFWRSDTMGAPSDARITSCMGFTYAPSIQDPDNQSDISGVFFTLNDTTTTTPTGDFITAYRNGDDEFPTDVRYVNETAVAGIPGLSFATAGSVKAARGITFNPIDGLLYLYFDFVNSTTVREPYWFGLSVSYNTSSAAFQYTVVASGSAAGSGPKVTGFSRGTGTNDNSMITLRELAEVSGATYVNSRDTLAILRTYEANRTDDYPDLGVDRFNELSFSFLYETAAGSVTSSVIPGRPSTRDGLWGSVSGTLDFEDISTQGINYPAGRLSQIEYQLNASPDRKSSPKLTASVISSGLRLGTISAGGTTEMYVRTNIDSDKLIGDQQGRIKVFFEMEE